MLTSQSDRPIRLRTIISEVGNGHKVRTGALLAALRTPVEIVEDGSFDAILTDIGYRPFEWWENIRVECRPVITIDDEGGPVYADFIINGTPCRHHYPNRPTGFNDGRPPILLAAPEYALVRPEFAATTRAPMPYCSMAVIVGSGHRAAEWGGLLRNQLGLPEIYRWFTESGQHQTAKEIAQNLAKSSVALVTGGMAMYEALAVGVPTIVFPQERNLVVEAEWFERRGAIINFGYDDGMDIERVHEAIHRLSSDPPGAIAMAQRGHTIVDGLGVTRVAAEVDRFLESLR